MLEALENEFNLTRTENGGLAYRSTGSDCLDFFSACGALRHADETVILYKFMRAYAEDPDTAMKLLFYARDIRGGLGERRLFRCILRDLAKWKPSSVVRNLPLIAEYGRFDDVLLLLDTPCEEELIRYLRAQLAADLAAMEAGNSVSLLAKWLPSVNTSSPKTKKQAKTLCRLLGMREKDYRKTLSTLRSHIGIVEDALRRRDYTFDYEDVPSGALLKYRHALFENDGERYSAFLDNVREGSAQMHTGTLYPYEIVRAVMEENDPDRIRSLDITWNALPDDTDARNAIAVIDGSGSMYADYGAGILPITVALSLGIYFAEHNRGRFANRFITFSETPHLVRIKGDNIAEKVKYCQSFNEVANTDLYAVFRLLLKAAVKYHIPQEELPEIIYIISDMEFDLGTDFGSMSEKTVFRRAKALYEKYGYRLPQVVYWNVCARNEQVPVTRNESGTALVSGSSPALFRQMMSQEVTPLAMMEQILTSERYRSITA